MYSRTLVPIDGSPTAERGLEEALAGGAGMIAEGVERGLRLYALAMGAGGGRAASA